MTATSFTVDEIEKIVNDAANDIQEEVGNANEAASDLINLLVNTIVHRLAHPEASLHAVINANWSPEDILDETEIAELTSAGGSQVEEKVTEVVLNWVKS